MNKIKKLEQSHLPRLRKFISKEYNPNYILLDDNFFNWQFKLNPYNFYKEYSMYIADYKNKIIGCNGTIPISLKVQQDEIIGGIFVNLVVNKESRAFGLGVHLIKKANEDFSVCYLTGYNSSTKTIYEKLDGWTDMGFLRRFIKVLNPVSTSVLINKKLEAIDTQKEYSNSKLLKVDYFSNEIDTFWNEIKIKYPITCNRTKKYLNWRYSSHPIFDYLLFELRLEGKIKGYSIIRIENFSTNNHDYKIGRIVDLICYDEFEEQLISLSIQELKERRVDFVDFFFTGEFHVGSLLNQGFVEDTEKAYKDIPMLFSPLDKTKKGITWAVYFRHGKNKNYLTNKNNWYVTKGDGDQDRPNIYQ